jgi:hypothetical protein
MTSVTDIADALVSLLNGHRFSQKFEAKRRYQPDLDLRDTHRLQVSVVPRGRTREIGRGATTEHEYRINLAVQKKVGRVLSDYDELMALVEEFEEFLAGRANRQVATRSGSVILQKIETNRLWIPEHLQQFDQFTSVQTLSYFSLT